jgi:hypothetical protein
MSFMAEGNDGIRPNQVFIMDHGTINTSLGTRLCIVFKYAIGLWNATVGQIYWEFLIQFPCFTYVETKVHKTVS